MHKIAASGFTLVEMLITITILGILAAAAIPLLSANDPQKLSAAAEETANLLRFALSEAKRTGGYVLVDGFTTPGQLSLYISDVNANKPPTSGTSQILDPLTKRAAVLILNTSTFSDGTSLTPNFIAAFDGAVWTGLLIGPGLTQLQACRNVTKPKGALATGSGVLLSYGSQSVTVRINEVTGLVTLP